MDENLRLLVLDTLFDRKTHNNGTCLVVNEAGQLLLKCAAKALPIIEDVLRQTVDPVCTADLDYWWNYLGTVIHDSGRSFPFPGLRYVLGAYLVIGARTSPDRIIAFLRTLSLPLIASAVRDIPTWFRWMGDHYNCGVAPSREYLDYVSELTQSQSDHLRSHAVIAQNWIIKVSLPPGPQHH